MRAYKCAIGYGDNPPVIDVIKVCDGSYEFVVDQEWTAYWGIIAHEQDWCGHMHRSFRTASLCKDRHK